MEKRKGEKQKLKTHIKKLNVLVNILCKANTQICYIIFKVKINFKLSLNQLYLTIMMNLLKLFKIIIKPAYSGSLRLTTVGCHDCSKLMATENCRTWIGRWRNLGIFSGTHFLILVSIALCIRYFIALKFKPFFNLPLTIEAGSINIYW